MLRLRHEADDRPDHFQVYTGQVRIGTIYKTSGNPAGNQWYWGLNGVQNGPGPFNGFVRTLEDGQGPNLPPPGARGSRPPGCTKTPPQRSSKTRIPDRRDYISAMPKRSPRIKLFEWRVIQLKATPARLIDYFKGASAEDAIKQAIVEREISDPLTQSRLAAYKVREIAI
jgi:hypothetical protein